MKNRHFIKRKLGELQIWNKIEYLEWLRSGETFAEFDIFPQILKSSAQSQQDRREQISQNAAFLK